MGQVRKWSSREKKSLSQGVISVGKDDPFGVGSLLSHPLASASQVFVGIHFFNGCLQIICRVGDSRINHPSIVLSGSRRNVNAATSCNGTGAMGDDFVVQSSRQSEQSRSRIGVKSLSRASHLSISGNKQSAVIAVNVTTWGQLELELDGGHDADDSTRKGERVGA